MASSLHFASVKQGFEQRWQQWQYQKRKSSQQKVWEKSPCLT
jgi:hypothetical protein